MMVLAKNELKKCNRVFICNHTVEHALFEMCNKEK